MWKDCGPGAALFLFSVFVKEAHLEDVCTDVVQRLDGLVIERRVWVEVVVPAATAPAATGGFPQLRVVNVPVVVTK